MNDELNTKAPLRVLLVEDRQFQRRLIAETLRSAMRVDILMAESADHCVLGMAYFQPDAIITDWDLEGGKGVALVKRLRAGEAGEGARGTPVVMVTARSRESDVAYARNAGVDEFVLRPFSAAVLLRRLMEVTSRRREFVESAAYLGPCRRRRGDETYEGPRRRVLDKREKRDDAPELQIRKGLARMYAERIGLMLRDAKAGDRDAMRDLCLAAGQLSALCGDMGDALLQSAASSLFNYLKGVGADGAPIHDVVQAHLDALVQLSQLPNYQIEVRQTVAQQLGVMVTKKLRAGAAA